MKTIAVFSLLWCATLWAGATDFPQRIMVSDLKHEDYHLSFGVAFERADGSYVHPITAASVDRILIQKDGSTYVLAYYLNESGVLTLLAEPVIVRDASRPPMGTARKVDGEYLSCTRIALSSGYVDLYVKRGVLVVERVPSPNPSAEATHSTGSGFWVLGFEFRSKARLAGAPRYLLSFGFWVLGFEFPGPRLVSLALPATF